MKTLLGLLLAAALLGAGCAHGPVFGGTEDPPPDKALIYFYRTEAMTGAAMGYGIKRVETKLGTLRNGSYFHYPADPGVHTFYYEGINGYAKVTVEVLAGEAYFIRGRLSGFLGSSFNGPGGDTGVPPFPVSRRRRGSTPVTMLI
jgi:hypothetical protein